ncbi:aromatic-L-amino-acid decarboxylase [Microvirga aerophila]|uniref:Aromatic-L-amino-acid decarboxylase n=2 Tax=Microvirga aerophila TaxID=670291 RepID=A0A512C2X1_9HYPH|nr:aromatic-L-amino-acid decarboxylase [Microvirga aerophila]
MPQDELQDQMLDVASSATIPEVPSVAGEDGIAPPLGDMSAEEFRRHGRAVVDWMADYFERVEQLPVLAQVEPGEPISKLPAEPPESGRPMEAILADVDRLVVPALTHWSHPGFFAYFATSTSAPGIFGEMLSAAFDVKALLWRGAPAAQELEEVTLSWLRQMIGLPKAFSGIIYDTASVSTLHAIAAAREGLDLRVREDGMSGRADLPLLRVYASEQAHSSVEKCVITLGLGQRSLRKVPTDAEFRMDPAALARAIEEDRAAGHLPFCVVATVGTTSTSSIDPVPAIADLCGRERLWLHVDAAYAGSAAVVPELRHILDGSERADSLVLNPHKWLMTPFDLSVLFTRRMDLLHRAFSLVPEYLRTLDREQEAVRNHSEYGIQLGRRFRALKFWMVLRYFGRDGLAARIREHCRLARLFASWFEAAPGWELLAPVPLSLVCFRACPPRDGETADECAARLDRLNEQIMHAVNASGEAFLSHTKLHDCFTLRLAVGNIRTTEQHVARVWQLLREAYERLDPAGGG